MNTKETYLMAIQNEISARNMYLFLKQSVNSSELKTRFENLAKYEEQHREKLFNIFKDCFPNENIDVDDSLLPDKITDKAQFDDIAKVLKFAAEMEDEAYKMYINMIELETDEEVKSILKGLAEDEAKHKEVISDEIIVLNGNYIWFDPSELNGLMED